MQKSTPPETFPKGNSAKCLSYRECWARIKAARSEGFFLEAVTLQESIISDRLISYLVSVNAFGIKTELHQYPNFKQLIYLWKKQHPFPITAGDTGDLQGAVDAWRVFRNKVVHGLVKSHPGSATEPLEDFMKAAMATADEGEKLARAVSNWCKKATRQGTKHIRKPELSPTDPA